MTKAALAFRGRNPDVLTCIANLSNDAVFTPPELANRMLDTLEEAWAADNDGASIWADPNVTFLDPFTKSGVFLREIVKRLTDGLEEAIPDRVDRVDHILTKQVYGVATETLTALLARRSVYCSKYANGPHSVAKSFDNEYGNIWFERTNHTWVGGTERVLQMDADGNQVERTINGRCKYCGASQKEYERDDTLETHAYAFIHTDNIDARIAELFGEDMQFDVIIGNPPYQLTDGGAGTSAIPIYHKFITQAKALEPRFLAMVTPSRWMAGGKGLDGFRKAMLNDRNLRVLVDYIDASDAFPGVDVAGGISYFLWNRDSQGDCAVTSIHRGVVSGPIDRRLDEFDVFVRSAAAVEILHKVWPDGPKLDLSMGSVVAARKAFGFATNERGKPLTGQLEDPIELISSASSPTRRQYVERSAVTANRDWIGQWKSTVGGAAPAGGRPDKDGRYYGLSSIRVLPPDVVCTESYLIAGHFENEAEARNLSTYLRTRFVRFLVSLRAVTQHVTRGSFAFVPIQDFTESWTDEKLFAKYGLSEAETSYIEQTVRPMGMDE